MSGTRTAGGAGTLLTALTVLLVLTSVAGLAVIVGAGPRIGGASAGRAAPAGGPLTRVVGGIALHLGVSPAALGTNRLLVTISDARGRPVTAGRVRLLLTMRDMPMGTTALDASPAGGGRYQAVGTLSMPGNWGIAVAATGGQVPAAGLHATFALKAAVQSASPMLTPLPVAGRPSGAASGAAAVGPAAVRWAGLPYPAVVSFLGNGLIYLPGTPTLLRVGQLNHSVTRAPDGTFWVMDYLGNRVAVIAPRAGRVVASIPVGLGPVHAVFSPDGRRAYVSDFVSNEVSVIDVRVRRVLARVTVGMHPHGLAISPDGRQVWVPCSGAGGLWVIDTHTNTVTGTYAAGLLPHAAAFSPDGRTVYMTDAGQGDLVVLARSSGTVGARIHVGTGSAMTAVGPAGRDVYVTGQSGGVVTVVDAARRKVVARITVGGAPHGLTFTPDGHLLYVAVNNARQVAVIDTATNKLVATVALPGQADEVALSR